MLRSLLGVLICVVFLAPLGCGNNDTASKGDGASTTAPPKEKPGGVAGAPAPTPLPPLPKK